VDVAVSNWTEHDAAGPMRRGVLFDAGARASTLYAAREPAMRTCDGVLSTQAEQHFVSDISSLPWFAVRNGSLLILAVIDPGTCTVRCVDDIFVALLLPSLILVVGLGAAIIRGWLLLRLPEQPLLAWFRARTKHILSISASPRG
jgi:hypothetical protein